MPYTRESWMHNNDFFHDIPLSEVCGRMVDASGRPLKAIAADVGKTYSVLYRELDDEDTTAKLGVNTMLPLIRACMGSAPYDEVPAPVLWLNSKTGYKAVPLNAEPNHDNIHEEIMDDLNRCNAFWQAVNAAKLTPEKVVPLMHAAQKELDETMEGYRRLWQRTHTGSGE